MVNKCPHMITHAAALLCHEDFSILWGLFVEGQQISSYLAKRWSSLPVIFPKGVFSCGV